MPLAFILLLLEQVGRFILKFYYPVARIAEAQGGEINVAITVIMTVGLVMAVAGAHTHARPS